jgi:hypothetical protein
MNRGDRIFAAAWVGGFGLAGVVLVLVSTSLYGVGISPDSTTYISVARELLAGRGYVTFDGTPYTQCPPLFPTLLAAVGGAGLDPAVGARFVNALAFGGIVLASGIFFFRHLRSPALAAVATSSVLLSPGLLGICVMAWTEPLFVLWILLLLLALSAFLRGRRLSSLLAASLFAALCLLTRYPGVAVIPPALVLLLAPRGPAGLGRHLRRAALFLALACTPLALYCLRNYRRTGLLTGCPRLHSIYTVRQNLSSTAEVVTGWLMSPSLSLALRVGLLATLLLLVIGAILFFRRRAAARPDDDGLCAAPAGLVLLTYVPLIFYTHQVGVLDETMNDRYLAPVSVLILWLLFVGIDRLATLLRARRARGTVPAHATIGLCVIWLLFYPSARTKEMVRSMQRYGSGGYSTAAWQELPLIRWLHAHPLQGLVRTNAPGAVYALTGMRALVSPHRDWDIPRFREQPGEYLVWFTGQPGSFLLSFEDLASELFLEEVVRGPGGGVYRFLPSAVCVFPESKVFSPCVVNGLWSRTFNSGDSDALGTISSWVLRADGTTESVWELARADGSAIRWHAGGPYTRSGATFQFHCGGQAGEVGGDANWPCQLEVHGVVGDGGATGTYRATFTNSHGPGALSGRWRVDLACPVRRFYSRATGRHAYTMQGDEMAELSRRPDLWIDEGIAFHAFPTGRPPPETRPVYRFRASTSDTPFFTIREQEKMRRIDDPAQAWHYDGVAFYAYPEERHPPARLPVYRFSLGTAGAHFYTASEAEKNTLLKDPAHRWVSEGIAWYALVDRP